MARSSTWCSLRRFGPAHRCAFVIRSRGYCTWCRCVLTKDTFQVDHVVPRRDGGKHADDNLVASCPDCNIVRPEGVPFPAEQLAEPLDLGAGQQLALIWYNWMFARLRAKTVKNRERRQCLAKENRDACAAGLGGNAFPFRVVEGSSSCAA